MWIQVYNASVEIAAAANYPMIRLFTAALESSSTPIDELISIEQNWSVAAPGKRNKLSHCIVKVK